MNLFWSQPREVELIFSIFNLTFIVYFFPSLPLSLSLNISVTALNWKWPIDYNGRCDETTAKYSDVKNGDFSHAITNVMPFEMIRIGCVTMASTPTMKTLPPFEHRHQHHRLIFPEQFGLTLMRFIRYQSIFVSSSPTFRTVACELRTTLLSLLDRWNSCSSAVVPLIERNQNEPIYRKRKSITVRNLFVPLIYIYLFRWNIYRNVNKFKHIRQNRTSFHTK